AGVGASYLPGIREKARQRSAENAAAQRSVRVAAEPEGAGDEGPSVLLRPERAVVEFIGRQDELAALHEWCESGPPKAVRIVFGAGGTGKTRLALQVAAIWLAADREWLMVAAGNEADAIAAARGLTSGPVLLIVDYAETRAALGDLLRAVLDDAARVRVLLLARSLGEWWDRLAAASSPAVARLLRESELIRLNAPVTKELSDAELAAASVPSSPAHSACGFRQRYW